jgi:antitoxin ParD1/3/4
VSIALNPELEKLVHEKVQSGLYSSASEVIREALRLLYERDQIRAQELDAVRAKLKRGIEQLDRGEGIPKSVAVERLTRFPSLMGTMRAQS